PVLHRWFLVPLARLLGLKRSEMERVVYLMDFVVVRPGDTPLAHGRRLTEDELREARYEFGERFEAAQGAEACRLLLEDLVLPALSAALLARLAEGWPSRRQRRALRRRLALLDRLAAANPLDPKAPLRNAILDCVPVIPPELRPLAGQGVDPRAGEVNDLYA